MKAIKVLVLLLITVSLVGCSMKHLQHPYKIRGKAWGVERAISDTIVENTLKDISNSGYTGNQSVHLINNQPDKSTHTILKQSIHIHQVDYNEWTGFLIDILSEELQKKGVAVSPDSPNKILVKLTDLKFEGGAFADSVYTTIDFKAKNGEWSETYNGSATRAEYGLYALIFSDAIYHTLPVIMENEGFLNQIKN